MTTLYNLVKESNELIEKIIQNDGEMTEDIESLFEKNELLTASKIDSYDFIIKKLNAESELMKDKAKMFTSAAKSLSNNADAIKTRIKATMHEMNITELKGNSIRFTLSPSRPSMLIDMDLLPDQYKKIEYSADKDLINSDEIIPGVSYTPSFALKTYVNKAGK